MRCYICDSAIAEPKLNPELGVGKVDPCDHCMLIVEETLAGFTDRPSVAEDELGQTNLPFDVDFT